MLTLPETPRNAFTFVKRANRTIRNIRGKTHEDDEKANAEVLKIVNTVDVTTHVRTPSNKHKISEHVSAHLEQLRAGVRLDAEDQARFDSAMAVLSGEVHERSSDSEGYSDWDNDI